MPLFPHFDLVAPLYEKIFPFREPQILIDLAGLPTQGALLDAAGGTGRVSSALRRFASQVVVADLSRGMLKQAVENHGLPGVRSHTEALPFPEGYFSRIVMIDALHHVRDHQETAIELWRILQPGGRIVIEEPNIEKLGVKFVALFEKIALMRSHFLAPDRIASLFSFSSANIRIEHDHFNAYILVDKP